MSLPDKIYVFENGTWVREPCTGAEAYYVPWIDLRAEVAEQAANGLRKSMKNAGYSDEQIKQFAEDIRRGAGLNSAIDFEAKKPCGVLEISGSFNEQNIKEFCDEDRLWKLAVTEDGRFVSFRQTEPQPKERCDNGKEVLPPSKYHRSIDRDENGYSDVYDILRAFFVFDPAVAHALKKMLTPGERGDKSYLQDLKEARWSLDSAIAEAERQEDE